MQFGNGACLWCSFVFSLMKINVEISSTQTMCWINSHQRGAKYLSVFISRSFSKVSPIFSVKLFPKIFSPSASFCSEQSRENPRVYLMLQWKQANLCSWVCLSSDLMISWGLKGCRGAVIWGLTAVNVGLHRLQLITTQIICTVTI